VGKTSLAIEYAYRFREEYRLVWWIRAEHAAVAADDLGRLLIALTGDTELANVDVIARLWRELRAWEPWLLVFDNAREQSSLSDVWPIGGEGHVIVTSRADAWGGLADETLTVEVFSRDEAIMLLQARTRSEDHESAAFVADKLGRLPLALVQAAEYVNQTKTTLQHYSELVERQMGAVIMKTPPAGYSAPVATTWSMSIEEADALARGAKDLLIFFAYLAPEAIPRALANRCAPDLPGELSRLASNDVAYDLAIGALSRYSLITAASDQLSLHRLVQFTVRLSLSDDAQRDWAGVVVKALDRLFPESPLDPESRVCCAELAPHVLSATAHAAQAGSLVPTGSLLSRTGVYHMTQDLLESALALLEMALLDYARTTGEDSLEVAAVCGELARVQHRRAALAEALVHSQRAIRIKERMYGTSAPELIEGVAQLGSTLLEMSRLNEAQDSMERALALAEAAYGDSDRRVIPYLLNLFWLQMRRGHYGTALGIANRALSLVEHESDNSDRHTALLYEDVGTVQYYLGNFDLAKQYSTLSMELFVQLDGPETYEPLKREQGVANALTTLGEPLAAIDVLTHSINGLRRIHGGDHPDVAASLRYLGEAQLSAGMSAEAVSTLTQSLSIYENFYENDHPYVAQPLIPLATAQLALREVDGAQRSLDRAFRIIGRRYGAKHPLFGEALSVQSKLYRILSDQRADSTLAEAENIIQAAREA
jgi:tetratricopeptide (TPR) repeat protein